MALFVAENPVLGAGTTLQEISGAAGTPAGNPVVNAYKPTTRQIMSMDLDAVRNTAAQLTGWIFRAPWACKVVAVEFVCTTVASVSSTVQAFVVPFASQPAAPSAGNGILSAALNVNSGVVANTVSIPTLNATASQLILGAGDLIGYNLSAAPTSLAGGLLQIEVVQLG